MTQEDKKTRKKIAEGKAATKAANKKKEKATLKKAADKVIADISEGLPAGGANLLKNAQKNILKIRAQKKVLNAAERAEFAKLKEAKISIYCFKQALRWAEMEPGDVKAEKATTALYSQQMDLELSPQDKEVISEMKEKRDAGRKATLGSGDAGEEIGSGSMVGHNSEGTEGAPDEDPAMPEKNESLTHSHIAGARVTH